MALIMLIWKENIDNIYIGEKLLFKILVSRKFHGAEYKSEKDIVVIFNQACGKMLSFNDNAN